jgi:triacylglycerol lipase
MSDSKNYPIVLAHGIARFDVLTDKFIQRSWNPFLWDFSRAFDRLHYFKRISSHLRDHGFTVYATRVRFAPSADTRADNLHQEVLNILQDSGRDKVHIIGHSMGGLDARRMIVKHQMADKVATVTSIGSPHLGTSFADVGLSLGGRQLIELVHDTIDLTGFLDLTRAVWRELNEQWRNEEATNSVVYQTYAAAQERELIFTPLRGSWDIIFAEEGMNDGLVSLTSQRWADKLVADDGTEKAIIRKDFPVSADHFNQTGWWDVSELRAAPWWRRWPITQKRRYEAAIRNAYLSIAQELVEK